MGEEDIGYFYLDTSSMKHLLEITNGIYNLLDAYETESLGTSDNR